MHILCTAHLWSYHLCKEARGCVFSHLVFEAKLSHNLSVFIFDCFVVSIVLIVYIVFLILFISFSIRCHGSLSMLICLSCLSFLRLKQYFIAFVYHDLLKCSWVNIYLLCFHFLATEKSCCYKCFAICVDSFCHCPPQDTCLAMKSGSKDLGIFVTLLE